MTLKSSHDVRQEVFVSVVSDSMILEVVSLQEITKMRMVRMFEVQDGEIVGHLPAVQVISR